MSFNHNIAKMLRDDLIHNKILFLILFLSFFIIHGEIVFHKISFWDDTISAFGTRFFMNEGLAHGRWTNHIFDNVIRIFAGTESLPVVNGIIVALSICFLSLVLFSMFKIKDTAYQASFGFILLSIPVVAADLAYGYWAGKDFIGRLICIIAAYITCETIHKKGKLSSILLGSFLFACALGEYQCHFALYLTLCLMYLMNFILQNEVSCKVFLKYFLYYIINIAIGLGIYLLILRFFLNFEGTKLLSYANTDYYGIVSFQEYLDRISFAYKSFFYPYLHSETNMFPFHWKSWYKIIFLINLFLSGLVMLFSIKQKRRTTLYQYCFLLLLFPAALNFNGILYGWQFVHSLHVYQHVLIFLLPFILYRAVFLENDISLIIAPRLTQWSRCIVILTTVIFACLYIRYDNYCYMLSEFRQTQAIRYFTTLSTRIMAAKGYRNGLPVSFINETMKQNSVDIIQHNYDYPCLNPFYYPIVNSYVENSRAFMKHWCGFSPRFVNSKIYESNSIVNEMSCYPDDGSIKIIDDVVVVKFK